MSKEKRKDLPDHKDRNAIIINYEDNIFVSSGAGTGKTTCITKKIVHAISDKKIKCERILVSTFTEKAAYELIFRIRVEAEKNNPEAAAKLNLMSIGTLHSVCLAMLKERPLESRINPEADIIDEDTQEKIIKSISDKIIEDEIINTDEGKEILYRYEINTDSLNGIFKTLYEYRDMPPIPPAKINEDIEEFYARNKDEADKISALLKQNTSTSPDGYELLNDFYSAWKSFEKKDKSGLEEYLARLYIPKIDNDTWAKSNNRRISILIKEIIDAIQEDFKQITGYKLYRLFFEEKKLYKKFENEYTEYKNKNALMDFNDILIRTRDLLKNSPDARNYFHNKFDLIIIDEFQDTDPLLSEVILYIAQENGLGAENIFKNAKPVKGRLIAVGDDKQSIYRFRRADIKIYERMRDIFKNNGRELYLTANFRSHNGLIKAFNAAFQNIFSGTSIAYKNLDAGRESKAGAKTVMFLDLKIDDDENNFDPEKYNRGNYKNKDGLNAETKREREAIAVTDFIKNKIKSGGYGYGDFMLLFKNRKIMKDYAVQLFNAKIPCRTDGEGSLLLLPEITDIIKILISAVRQDDSLSFAAALNTIYLGAGNNDMLAHKKNGGYFNAGSDPAKGNNRTNKAIGKLKNIFGFYNMNNFETFIKKTIDHLNIENILLQTRGDAGYAIYQGLIKYLQSVTDNTVNPVKASNIFSEDIMIGKNTDTHSFYYEKPDEVQLLTIYKAKGLESKVVILCDVILESNKDIKQIFDRENNRLYYTGGFYSRNTKKDQDFKYYKYPFNSEDFDKGNPVYDDELNQKKEEDKRLVYVAATRAKDLLIIPTYRGSPAKFYAGLFNEIQKTELYEKTDCGEGLNYKEKCVIAEPEVQSTDKTNSGITDAVNKERASVIENINKLSEPAFIIRRLSEEVNEEKILQKDGYGPAYGALFHDIMNRLMIIAGNYKSHGADEIDMLQKKALKMISGMKASGEINGDETEQNLIRHTGSIIKNPLIIKCLKSDERHAEYPVEYFDADGRELKKGVIDLLYKDKDSGKWIIIDYKTNKINGNEELEKFKKEYKKQTDAYIKALKDTMDIEAEGHCVFAEG